MSSNGEMFEFSVTSANGITLATANKVCKKNIKVISALQEKSAKANGTVIPDSGYAGLSKVNVNLPFQAKEANGNGVVTPDVG